MAPDRENGLVSFEVAISCEDRNVPLCGDGAEQKIRVGALNTAAAANVEKVRSDFVILGAQLQIRECTQPIPELYVLFRRPNT